ncbi:MAG: SGNH/GDSL hydrolase family protein [Steroidobacteraceae bacterium]
MKKTMGIVCGCLLAVALCCAVRAADAAGAGGWVQTWGAAPQPPSQAAGPFPGTPSFSNETIRETIRVSVGGRRIRILFTNAYGRKPLAIGAASVALSNEKGAVVPGTVHPVLFSGKRSALIPPAAPFLSDPIDLPVGALASLSISIYLPQDTGPCTCHATGAQTAFVSGPGNFVDVPFKPKSTTQVRMFISGVDVEPARGARAVVVLGDSISDGVGATVDANRRWPDLLANRLDSGSAPGWGVVNMGISGNQLLHDGAGQSALARFDRDVLATPGVKTVIVFEGVNDLGISFGKLQGPVAQLYKAPAPVTEQGMIAGYRQLIARAHASGLRIIGATITPYGGASYYSARGEAIREAINAWIRTSHEFDGVIDFDAVMRDPNKPTWIRNGFQRGDHLHGNDAGYAAMAAAVDLSVLN